MIGQNPCLSELLYNLGSRSEGSHTKYFSSAHIFRITFRCSVSDPRSRPREKTNKSRLPGCWTVSLSPRQVPVLFRMHVSVLWSVFIDYSHSLVQIPAAEEFQLGEKRIAGITSSLGRTKPYDFYAEFMNCSWPSCQPLVCEVDELWLSTVRRTSGCRAIRADFLVALDVSEARKMDNNGMGDQTMLDFYLDEPKVKLALSFPCRVSSGEGEWIWDGNQ